MAIVIPAVVDTQIDNLRNELLPNPSAATDTEASSKPPIVKINRFADLLRILTDLIDSGTLTETAGGSAAQFTDAGAFTGVNSLVGATFTFDAATTTVALRGVSRRVASNTVNDLVFDTVLPANTAIGDVGVLEFTSIDKDLDAMEQTKGLGDGAPNPYGPGPSLANASIVLMTLLGATLPPYLDGATGIANAEPFGLFNMHGGGDGLYGHGGATLVADLIQQLRDAVAGYTAPA